MSHQGQVLVLLTQTFQVQGCQTPAEAQAWALHGIGNLSFPGNRGGNTLKLLCREEAYDYIGVHMDEKLIYQNQLPFCLLECNELIPTTASSCTNSLHRLEQAWVETNSELTAICLASGKVVSWTSSREIPVLFHLCYPLTCSC